MAEHDLMAVLGLERETLRLGDQTWQVRAPGELTFVQQMELSRLLSLAKALEGQATTGMAPDAGEGSGLERDEAELMALVERVKAEYVQVMGEIRGLIIVNGQDATVGRLPDAGLEVAIRLFLPALAAMKRSISETGAASKAPEAPPSKPSTEPA